MRGELIAFDIETTGLDVKSDEIIEIGMVKFADGAVLERYNSFVKPPIPIPEDITHLTRHHARRCRGCAAAGTDSAGACGFLRRTSGHRPQRPV